jgi:SAM-dependent methyltransferase
MGGAPVPVPGPGQGFLEGIAPPAGHSAVPNFDHGWVLGGGAPRPQPFLPYLGDEVDVGWSAELEALHSDSTREHFIDIWTREATVWAFGEGGRTSPAVIADLGCSSGHLLENLRNAWPLAFLVGVDAEASGLTAAHARVPDAALFQASAVKLPFATGSIDGIFALNLLEHIADDSAALREIFRVLQPGGRAVLVVPWNPGLFDYYDVHLQHERRYARGELAAKARRAGLSVASTFYLGFVVYPAFWVIKKRNRLLRRRLAPDEARDRVAAHIGSTRRARLGLLACRAERALLRCGVRIPVGVREITVVERRDSA